MNQLQEAFKLFDEYNQQDPRSITWRNAEYPLEYAYSLMLSQWVVSLQSASSEELLLASRSQHIGRWEIPRETYPEGREHYLKWRKDLAGHHAAVASSLMQKAGYEENKISRVREIILKKRIKQDAEVQIMENALCLLFLEYQYEDLRKKYLHDPEKIVNILYKSLLKMDAHGHKVARLLNFSSDGLVLVKKAIELVNMPK
ncbi:DUF4202 domain-containing protein [Mucilaginibacter sabulilitoris]|uniref:DUF4202 domain-containing protein n=1 Tax=Mucilaginibacter sabulilitoris TaxID=1173583 RepID=A0ABZ0TFH2_9SPHI|nr:DUF4202 domain-containing protein [Mucilaginibacter sabulilitoris]WPU91722.1 DUF4202 domain-containing protein [Mucilaginibacter sabulilitoris]